jgi:hypothetical protein
MRKGCWQLAVSRWLVSRPFQLLLFFMILSATAKAQDVKVHAGFLEDSIKIGEQTRFYLSAKYPSSLNILFPDSTFTFAPFEYVNKTYFPTRSQNGVSIDSAVFYLTTFEVDRSQFLELPVFVVQPQDCTIYQSPRDSVLITQMVSQMPDSISADKLPLKMNTAYQKVFFEFNTWVLIIVVGALLIIAIVVWIIFGKKISRYFKAKRMSRKHSEFMAAYNRLVAEIQATFSPHLAESALSTWKKYMEHLEARPYTKLTTRETLKLIPDEGLGQNLRTLDQAIYGHSTSVVPSLETLKNFADERFSKKMEEVKNG